jgi:hypothetical protein
MRGSCRHDAGGRAVDALFVCDAIVSAGLVAVVGLGLLLGGRDHGSLAGIDFVVLLIIPPLPDLALT